MIDVAGVPTTARLGEPQGHMCQPTNAALIDRLVEGGADHHGQARDL